MKRISILLLTLLLSASLFSEGLNWSVWLDSQGAGAVQFGDDALDSKEDATLRLGPTTIDLTATYIGNGYGFNSILEVYTANYNDLLDGDEVKAKPEFTNTYAWANYLNGMMTVFGGIEMQLTSYSPLPAVESDFFFDGSGFGEGLGAYDYHCDWDYTTAVTGLAAEFRMHPISFMAAVRVDEDTLIKDYAAGDDANIILQAKYRHKKVVGYGGIAFRDSDEKENAYWLATELKLVDGLMSDIKWEHLFAPEKTAEVKKLSFNLGYGNLPFMDIKTETNLDFVDKGDNKDAADLKYNFDAKITPYLTKMFVTEIMLGVDGSNAKDSNANLMLGAQITKELGAVTNELFFRIDKTSDFDVSLYDLTYGYSVNIYF